MNERLTLRRLRGFLLAVTAALLAGTIVELVLVGHVGSPMQLVPFVLSIVSSRALRVATSSCRVAICQGSNWDQVCVGNQVCPQVAMHVHSPR